MKKSGRPNFWTASNTLSNCILSQGVAQKVESQMVTYRGVARSNQVGTQQMMQPSIKLEFKRDSKKARAEAEAAFVKLLKNTTPDSGATASLSVTDSHGHTTWLAAYEGKPTARTKYRSSVVSGLWTESKTGATVAAGTPLDHPQLEAYLGSH